MYILTKEIRTIIFIILATIISLSLLTILDQKRTQYTLSASLPAIHTPVPTTSPPLSLIIKADSPDGNKTIILKTLRSENKINYSVFTTDKSNLIEKEIINKSYSVNQSLSIPFNSWSPDNLYFFLKETAMSGNNYFVFNTDGKLFADNQPYVNIQELFHKKLKDFEIIEVTGWASPNLLIINTKTTQGETGPSFWFDMTTLSFIQLWTRFN